MVFDILFLIGRILVGGFYIISGFNHFSKKKFIAEYAKSKSIPLPELSVIVSGLFLIIGGLSFLFGIYPYMGVILISLFLILASLFVHNFWAVPKKQKISEMSNFMRNMVLLGSLLMFLRIPLPW